MTDMDQLALTRIHALSKQAQNDPKKAEQLRKRVGRHLARQKKQRGTT